VVVCLLQQKINLSMKWSYKVNFEYVSIPYSTIKDSDIKVTDEDISAY
jgi:hypothetical protein